MFLSQSEVQKDTDPPRFVSKTQPQKSELEYMWNVVFHWDIENKAPFSLQSVSHFTDSEVPWTWYAFKLRDDLRLKKINVRILNGQCLQRLRKVRTSCFTISSAKSLFFRQKRCFIFPPPKKWLL